MFQNPETFWADMTLTAYVVLLVPMMLLGFYFARRKMFFPHHKITMTLVLLLNWLLIGAVMMRSFVNGVVPGLPASIGDIRISLPTVHMLVGAVAQLMATYLVILMWTERTRFESLVPFRIRKIKTPMRITLALWLITVLMGVGIYAVWYNLPFTSASGGDPAVSTEEAPASTEEAVDPNATEAVPASTEDASGGYGAPASTEEAPASTEEASGGYGAPATTEEASGGYGAPASTEEPKPASTEESSSSSRGGSAVAPATTEVLQAPASTENAYSSVPAPVYTEQVEEEREDRSGSNSGSGNSGSGNSGSGNSGSGNSGSGNSGSGHGGRNDDDDKKDDDDD